jgi:urease accessory protein
MIRLTRKLSEQIDPDATLSLPLDSRNKSRLRVTLDDGRDAGLFLQRGTGLRHGDLLASDEGFTVLIKAAPETVSSVHCDDPLLLARASYHLGNRHVALQIGPGLLRYQHDHVLDAMLEGLGLAVTVERAPFEPEPGAYDGDQGYGHDREHTH